MKTLVVESGSMLGQVIMRYFSEAGSDVLGVTGGSGATDTLSIDIRSSAFTGFLATNHFDLVINCAAIGDPYGFERKSDAVWTNSFLPHMLAKLFIFASTRVFHLSTARIFSGASGPYTEQALSDNPLFVPRTRALGELVNEKDLTIRLDTFERPTCSRGLGFLLWFLRQTSQIHVASGVRFSPVSAPEAARLLLEAYELQLTGVWHLAPSEGTDAFDLARMFSEFFHRDLLIQDAPGWYSNRVLINTRDDVPEVQTYPEMIQSLLSWMESHEELYAASMRNCF